MHSTVLTSLSLVLAAVPVISAACTRTFLANVTEQYLKTQGGSASLSSFAALLAANATYSENDTPIGLASLSNSTLGRSIKIDLSRSYYDTTECASVTEFVSTDPAAPYIVHTRMLLANNADSSTATTNPTITTIESVVTKPGDWAFNATGYLHWSQFERWDPIPPAQRDSRAAIKAAGDAYFDRFDDVNITVPVSPRGCARLEGGSYTARGNFSADTCAGYPSTIKVTNRRYVVDEEMGVVDIFEGFPGLDRSVPRVPVPDSHLFRVEGGKIRYIHTVSHCIHWNCGLNVTTFGRRGLIAGGGVGK